MSLPLEAHDYIGLAAGPTSSASSSPTGEVGAYLTLRLGLPGSESPDRSKAAAAAAALPLFHHKGVSKRDAATAGVRREETAGKGDAAAGAPRAANPKIPRADRPEQIVVVALSI